MPLARHEMQNDAKTKHKVFHDPEMQYSMNTDVCPSIAISECNRIRCGLIKYILRKLEPGAVSCATR